MVCYSYYIISGFAYWFVAYGVSVPNGNNCTTSSKKNRIDILCFYSILFFLV